MARKEITASTASEWEAFCRADYAKYKREHAPPCIASFWSGSAFFNAFEVWSSGYKKHIRETGNRFWEEYGLYVVDWDVPSHMPIECRPIAEKSVTDS